MKKKAKSRASPPAVSTPPLDPPPLEQVIAWLAEGHREGEIRRAISSQWPKADPGQLQEAAVEHFAALASCETNVIIGWSMEALRALYQRMVETEDYRGAVRAVKELVAIAKHVQVENQNTNERPDGSVIEGDAEAAS